MEKGGIESKSERTNELTKKKKHSLLKLMVDERKNERRKRERDTKKGTKPLEEW